MMSIRMLGTWAVLGLIMSGCTIKATTDTTTDGTTEFVSSTTGKTWWTGDGLVREGEHAGAFVSVNYENLMQDIAKGEGEYLLAFGQILAVTTLHQPDFAQRLQQHFGDLSDIYVHGGEIPVKQFLHRVNQVMANSSS